MTFAARDCKDWPQVITATKVVEASKIKLMCKYLFQYYKSIFIFLNLLCFFLFIKHRRIPVRRNIWIYIYIAFLAINWVNFYQVDIAPAASRASTTSTWPRSLAQWRGVFPLLRGVFTLSPAPAASRAFTTSTWPPLLAQWRDVSPYLSRVFELSPLKLINARTNCRSPSKHAQWKVDVMPWCLEPQYFTEKLKILKPRDITQRTESMLYSRLSSSATRKPRDLAASHLSLQRELDMTTWSTKRANSANSKPPITSTSISTGMVAREATLPVVTSLGSWLQLGIVSFFCMAIQIELCRSSKGFLYIGVVNRNVNTFKTFL